jgi:hypothetical protein
VDLCHHRRIDHARSVVEFVVCPLPALAGAEGVTDCVVLLDEERVQERQTDPEVAAWAFGVEKGVEVGRVQAVIADPELPLAMSSRAVVETFVAAIDL